jgi:hypothetical protein
VKRKTALSWCLVKIRGVDRLSAAMSDEVIYRRSMLGIAKYIDMIVDYCPCRSLGQDPYRYLFVDSLVKEFPDRRGETLRLGVFTCENM